MNEAALTMDAITDENGVFQDGWLDSFPEGTFEKDDTGKLKTANLADHKDFPSLLKSHVNLQSKLGTAIQPLKEDATPEERAEFHQRFGCPKTVEGYELKAPAELPEGMEYRQDLVDAVSAIAFGEGASKQLMQKLAAGFNQWQIESFKTQKAKIEAAINKTFDDNEAALKVEWGEDFDKNSEIINKLAAQAPEVAEITKCVFDVTGKGNHPVLHKALYKLALRILPDTVVTGGVKTGKTTVPGQLDYSTVVGK